MGPFVSTTLGHLIGGTDTLSCVVLDSSNIVRQSIIRIRSHLQALHSSDLLAEKPNFQESEPMGVYDLRGTVKVKEMTPQEDNTRFPFILEVQWDESTKFKRILACPTQSETSEWIEVLNQHKPDGQGCVLHFRSEDSDGNLFVCLWQ